MDITMFFLRRPHWTRSDLHLQEKAFHKAEVFSALKAVGFTKTRAYDSRNHLHLQEVGRSFVFAEKPL
jgi:hypothetical protein